MKDGFFLFDTHTHIGLARHSGRRQTADQLLREMDRCGVDRSVVIPFPVVDDYTAAHEEIGAAVAAYPDRLTGAACLNPFLPEQTFRDEVRRCREVHGFRALKFQPQYQGLNTLSERSNFLFETALASGMALIAHTGSGIPHALPSVFMFAARRYPDLKIVLAHCGGGGLLLADAIVAASFCPNIYLELSTLMPNHIFEVLQHIPAHRLMAGSDLIENTDVEMRKLLRLDVPVEQKQQMLSKTALAVFG
ncbi:MAG: amidohydrolase family protein [Acidobacteriota bacterium]|jgi:predicted TIM-barrel fold metal-dependent hydrolase|nr:amidohydrolase family protein [Bryobacteraceae bacterium CoA2 C42]MCA2964719.1 amidohydrolase family protein [Acidobacteriaceae bacterium]